MLAMGHAGKGLFDFGGLWLQWGVNVLSSGEYYPDAPKQLSYTILSIPENLSDGFAQALQDFSSGDRHRIWYGATNLAMIFSPYIAGKAGETGIVMGGAWEGEALSGARTGSRAAYLDDAVSPAKTTAVFNPLNKGPLDDVATASFRSGTYVEKVSTAPMTLYRVYGGTAGELGPYWTTTKPTGSLQSIFDSALDRAWGNTVEHVVKIEIPAGVKFYDGVAAAQGPLTGGGSQVLFPPGFRVPKEWIKK